MAFIGLKSYFKGLHKDTLYIDDENIYCVISKADTIKIPAVFSFIALHSSIFLKEILKAF